MATWSVSINRTSREKPFSFLDLQQLQNQVIAQNMPSLLFAEMDPVVTLGQKQIAWSQTPETLIQSLDQLKQKNILVVPGERGGNETWHGPGQWVCFMALPLESWVGDSKGVRKAIDQTLTRILPVIQEYLPEAKIEDGPRLGIWSKLGKVVSIGIKVQEGWMKSGFSVNAFPTENSFFGIHPCGLDAVPDFLFNRNLTRENWEKHFEMLPQKLECALHI